MTIASSLLHGGAAVICLVWAVLILCAGRHASALVLAAVCGAVAVWASVVALAPETPLTGLAGATEVLRNTVWCCALLFLCRRTSGPLAIPLLRRLAVTGGCAAGLALLSLVPGYDSAPASPSLGSLDLLSRAGLALVIILLAENLYRNADAAARWHVNLPAIALGGLAAFDVLLYADAALSRAFSPALLDARAALAAAATPLLAVAAVRDRRLRRDPPLSRTVIFHSATLVVAGAFLLGVGAAGEALRRLGADWGRAAQVGLLAGAVMVLAVAAASRTARSQMRRLVVDHFFTARYDYRREWLQCVATLSGPDAEVPAATRGLRAIADPVDSPAGALLLYERSDAQLLWAGSWNLPEEPLVLPEDHPLIPLLRGGRWVADLSSNAPKDLTAAFGPLWLAVPLIHHRDGFMGVALLAPPRAPFALDGEVFDLLRTLGREVAMFLIERRNAERLADQRRLQDYAQRFAFVAHDVKTVASQLNLVLANAADNIADPQFQQDMLLTVRASAVRIGSLIARLRQPQNAPSSANLVAPTVLLRRLASAQSHPVEMEEEAPPAATAAVAPERLTTIVTHLLNNAIEASPPHEKVRIRVQQEVDGRILVDIVDRGEGMTPEFIRDELFRPLSTSKPTGDGIGAWQARELLREAGGDLAVLSRPGGGTTMRLILPAGSPSAAKPALLERHS
jgi:putative PEP-CTERM system histidine kinase